MVVTWSDGGPGEVGFRVDRRIDGGAWTAIAYRPPYIKGHALNPQMWVDFLAPRNRALEYRVVALDAEDSSTSAAPPTPALSLPAVGR